MASQKLILPIFYVAWFYKSKSIVTSKIDFGRIKNLLFYVRITFRKTTKHKSLYFKINYNKINSDRINSINTKRNTHLMHVWKVIKTALFQNYALLIRYAIIFSYIHDNGCVCLCAFYFLFSNNFLILISSFIFYLSNTTKKILYCQLIIYYYIIIFEVVLLIFKLINFSHPW